MVRTLKLSAKLILLVIVAGLSFYAGSILAEKILPYTDCAKDLRCMENSVIGDKISKAIGNNPIESNCEKGFVEVCDVVTICMDGPCPWKDCRCINEE